MVGFKNNLLKNSMIKKILLKIFYVYSLVFTFGVFCFGIQKTSRNPRSSFLLLLLLPSVLYFIFKFKKRKLPFLKYTSAFSLVFLLIIFISGITQPKDILFILTLLPTVFYFILPEKQDYLPPEKILFSEEKEKVQDENLRMFLKTLSGVSLGFFLASLLNPKQAGAAFFGSLPGPGTVALKDTSDTKINPAREDGNLEDIKNALTSFGTNNIDEYDSTTTYVGKEDKDGNWVIQKIDTSSGTSITYATETNNPTYTTYSDAWTDRTSLTYQSYNQAF